MPTSSYSSTEPQKPTIKPQHSNFEDTLTLKSTLAFLSQKKRQAELHVLSPLQAIFKDAFKHYPTATSYFMVLCSLSLLPIMCFVGFSLFTSSALLAIGLVFVITWGGLLLGSALVTLLFSLAFLALATFWIVLGLFSTISVLRLIYNIQAVFVQKIRDSQVIRDMGQHLHNKRLEKQQQEQEAHAQPAGMNIVDGASSP